MRAAFELVEPISLPRRSLSLETARSVCMWAADGPAHLGFTPTVRQVSHSERKLNLRIVPNPLELWGVPHAFGEGVRAEKPVVVPKRVPAAAAAPSWPASVPVALLVPGCLKPRVWQAVMRPCRSFAQCRPPRHMLGSQRIRAAQGCNARRCRPGSCPAAAHIERLTAPFNYAHACFALPTLT